MWLEVYSDGSGTVSTKPAGYGYVVVKDKVQQYEGSGHLEFGTNNDAEMQGAIAGLSSLEKYFTDNKINPKEAIVCLVSDSEIILNWANGSYQFKQVDKMDKYIQLRELVQKYNVRTVWVRGHKGEVHNERCDKLANEARLLVKNG